MDSFRNKLIPTKVSLIPDLDSQEEFCNNSACEEDTELDCGTCLFSERFCKKALFEEWKTHFNNNRESDEQD